MTEFLVLQTASVPNLGAIGDVQAYRGNHTTHQEAAQAAITALSLRPSQVMFVIGSPAYVRFTAEATAVEG